MRKAERARKKFQPVSVPQRETLERLSKRAGIVLPEVRTKKQAGKALDRLEEFLSSPPQLEGFSASTGPRKGGGGDAPEESFPKPGEPYGSGHEEGERDSVAA
ncbi:MAG TPA: hypothetical protein VEW07_04930 [Solirubrobacterales bacterium]|nr:hypothetical protein [Solirubrobacterales bacterium]